MSNPRATNNTETRKLKKVTATKRKNSLQPQKVNLSNRNHAAKARTVTKPTCKKGKCPTQKAVMNLLNRNSKLNNLKTKNERHNFSRNLACTLRLGIAASGAGR